MPDPASLPDLTAPDSDPRLWLEEIDGARATAWADAASQATLARFGDARFEADRDAVKAALDEPARIPSVTRRGGLLYNFWQDAAHPRGLWRRTTLDSYRGPAPAWDLLLDIDALAAAEGEDWIWHGATTLPPAHDRAIVYLSRGGGDATVLREFDIPGLSFVTGGFTAAEAKGGVDWLDRDTLLLSSALGEGMATQSGYARTVRLWSRGTDPLAAPVIFETAAANMGAGAGLDRGAEPERIFFVERMGFYEAVVHLGDRTGARRRVDLPKDADYRWHRGWLAVRPRTPWTIAGATHAPDAVLGLSFDTFLDGRTEIVALFTPGDRRALQDFFWCDGRLVLSILDDLAPLHLVWTPGEAGWTETVLDGLPPIGIVSVWPLDAEETESDGTLLANVQDPVTPPRLLQLSAGLEAPLLLKRSPALYDASGLVVTRHEAVSVDGERIPYVQVGPTAETGDAPVHMTGYGGFRVPILPAYATRIGKLWLEKGGTSVTAAIRGGGEFGTRWHEAGMRERKALAHADFAAVAEDLVRRGVTVPGRIAAEGGSNGGLLIGNMLTRFPDRFGALFCTIPLLDMRRYAKLLAGASWVAEYGDPDQPEDWAFLQRISAYHLAAPGGRYPPILIATARKDDRVHPGHARKMAAKLQELGHEAWFYEPAAGGHGYGKDNAEVAAFSALGAAFLRRAIGWET
ncbi:MAG TPA: prolyl oligopeptidase family serine peptidase [Roseomonas sp.]|jgi:prolyl oligopeptidase